MDAVVLTEFVDNKAAAALYRRMGFVVDKVSSLHECFLRAACNFMISWHFRSDICLIAHTPASHHRLQASPKNKGYELLCKSRPGASGSKPKSKSNKKK